MEQVRNIAEALKRINVTAFFVGGCVRDWSLGKDCNDIDLCLVGVTDKGLVTDVLKKFAVNGQVKADVGNSFPVWKATIIGVGEMDFACARTEKAVGEGHRDFEVQTVGVSIVEDLKRRDLTINSIAKNVLTGELVDPFGGLADLQNKIARPTSEAFREDPLRVLRAGRFIAKFGLKPSVELLRMCDSLDANRIFAQKLIPFERVGAELNKVLDGENPSAFFKFLADVNWLQATFPELAATINVPQCPRKHPEGDVFTHTMLCLDICENDPMIRLAMLCHDLGKATTTVVTDTTVTAHGHEKVSAELTQKMLGRLKIEQRFIKKIATLAELHKIGTLTMVSDKFLRTTLRSLDSASLTFEDLLKVVTADKNGRGAKEWVTPNIGQERAAQLLAAGCLIPIVSGKKLIEMGFKPDKNFKAVIETALRLQDKGTLRSDNWMDVLCGTIEGQALGLKK